MQRFFAEKSQIDQENKKIRLVGNDVNHIRTVLRMKPGEEVWISDGEKYEYHCVILSLTEEEILLDILYAQEPAYELPGRIVLFQGLPKADKMELIIQKAAELGAHCIVPVNMKRCVMKLDEKRAEKKLKRWQQIAQSAAEQSRRMLVPEICALTDLDGALRMAQDLDVILIPYELEKGMARTREVLDRLVPGQSIGIFIGPEGGFEEEEVEKARKAGAVPITLGHRILRTETAGLALLSVLMFRLEGD